MQPIKLAIVFINESMYQRFFTANPNVSCSTLIGIDNRQSNRGLPEIYNDIIERHQGDDCWYFFVHEDFEIKSGLDIVEQLDPNFVYGTFGIRLQGHIPVGYGQHICSNKNGSDPTRVGLPVAEPVGVQTLDCQSVLVHDSLLARYPTLRFDENLAFDLYAEDFCLNARENHGLGVRVFPLEFQHYSYGKVTQRYHTDLRYLARKYPHTAVAGSCSFIGGRAHELERHFTYDIPANQELNNRLARIWRRTVRMASRIKHLFA